MLKASDSPRISASTRIRRHPNARSSPISRVRSTTDMIIVFIIPTPPTRTVMRERPQTKTRTIAMLPILSVTSDVREMERSGKRRSMRWRATSSWPMSLSRSR